MTTTKKKGDDEPDEEKILAHLQGDAPKAEPQKKRRPWLPQRPPLPAEQRPRKTTLLERTDPHLLTLNKAIQALRRTRPDLSGPLASARLRLFDAIRDDDKATAKAWLKHIEDGADQIVASFQQDYRDAARAISDIINEKAP